MKDIPVLIDLETMGQVPGSAIISIGAYNLATQETFYSVVDLASNFINKLTVDASTIEWWICQNDKAKEVLKDKNKVVLNEALLSFSEWLPKKDLSIWGDGACFDVTLTEVAYRKCNLVIPWKYTKVGCYRTLKNLYPSIKKERIGVHHKADDDARSNGLHLAAILNHIYGKSVYAIF